MRYAVMHKVDGVMEAGGPPDQKIIRGMGGLVQKSLEKGMFLDGAGLHRSALRVRLELREGHCTITPGPYEGKNELCIALVMIKAASIDEAAACARRFAEILGEAEIEIGPVVEAWDLGMVPKPAEPPTPRFLLLVKGDTRSERGEWPSREVAQALRRLEQQLTEEGVFVSSARLAPTRSGARLPSAKGQRRVIDGPFAESKELIAGYSIISVADKGAAVAWARRYAGILGENEVDVRELAD